MMVKAKNVNAYIRAAPKERRPQLTQLRTLITSIAPRARESISYGIPYYAYLGRLVYFGLSKEHIGLYALKGGTIHLPFDKKLPMARIRKLIRAQMKKNEKKARAR